MKIGRKKENLELKENYLNISDGRIALDQWRNGCSMDSSWKLRGYQTYNLLLQFMSTLLKVNEALSFKKYF